MANVSVARRTFMCVWGNTVLIDGNNIADDQRTEVEGHKIVQLRRARLEESGYNWPGNTKEVQIKNVLILDNMDVKCLLWFIRSHIRVKFDPDQVAVSPLISADVINALNELPEGMKAVEGSTILLPIEGGFSGIGRTAALVDAFVKRGFNARHC